MQLGIAHALRWLDVRFGLYHAKDLGHALLHTQVTARLVVKDHTLGQQRQTVVALMLDHHAHTLPTPLARVGHGQHDAFGRPHCRT